MKAKTTVGALVLATMISTAGLDAQRRPEAPRAPRAQATMQARQGSGPVALVRTVQTTLDRAELLGLSAEQVAGLEALRADVMAAGSTLRDQGQAMREARRGQMRQRLEAREPLPADPEERAGVLAQRQAERRAQMAETRAAMVERRARAADAFDPLVQRYEQLVPPSQRPRLRQGSRDGRRFEARDARRPMTRGGAGVRSGDRRGGGPAQAGGGSRRGG